VNAHRPDRDTSGVLLCARTKPALGELSRQFERNEVTERYLVMVRPVPEWREYVTDLRISPDSAIEGKMKAGGHGKEAETRVHVLEKWPGCALVEAFPRTHRKHQVRVHLAALGCPAVGDVLYGGCRGILLSEMKRRYKRHKDEPERPLLGRVALHLESLAFVHPESGQPLTVRAPMPDDFNVAMKYLSRFDVARRR
jgi:23S rRNA-/tRNA-specific pseudouridylate synthase